MPYDVIMRYADEHGLTGDMREDFVFFMQELDKAQTKFEFAEYEKQRKAAEAAAKKKKGFGRGNT